jgi:hypothetical protein
MLSIRHLSNQRRKYNDCDMSALPDLEQERHPPQLFPPIYKEIIVKNQKYMSANRVAPKGYFDISPNTKFEEIKF